MKLKEQLDTLNNVLMSSFSRYGEVIYLGVFIKDGKLMQVSGIEETIDITDVEKLNALPEGALTPIESFSGLLENKDVLDYFSYFDVDVIEPASTIKEKYGEAAFMGLTHLEMCDIIEFSDVQYKGITVAEHIRNLSKDPLMAIDHIYEFIDKDLDQIIFLESLNEVEFDFQLADDGARHVVRVKVPELQGTKTVSMEWIKARMDFHYFPNFNGEYTLTEKDMEILIKRAYARMFFGYGEGLNRWTLDDGKVVNLVAHVSSKRPLVYDWIDSVAYENNIKKEIEKKAIDRIKAAQEKLDNQTGE